MHACMLVGMYMHLLACLFAYLSIYLFVSSLAVLSASFIKTWSRITVNSGMDGMKWELPCGKADIPETLSFLI